MTSSEPHRVVDGVVQYPMADGTTIPQLGFGVWQVDDADRRGGRGRGPARRLPPHRHGRGVPQRGRRRPGHRRLGVSPATRCTSPPRWATTTRATTRRCGRSTPALERLGIEQVDLYLIHWAAPSRDLYVDTWRALVELQAQGRVRSIGVSNFNPPHLDRIVAETGVTPTINQIELHPYLQQAPLRAADGERGIVTESWSPLGQGQGLLDDPVLADIAAGHDATPAQVVIAWHLALGLVVIPKSVTPSRIAENFAARSLTLTADDIDRIAALDRGLRYGFDPDRM